MTSLFTTTTTYDPVWLLLNADSEEERDDLTQRWKDNKLQELNFVGIVGALLANVLTSTGSWPTILPNGRPQPWTVRCLWYIGILLSLSSVLTAAQQSIRLHRLSSHRDASLNIRRLLSQRRRSKDGRLQPRRAMVKVWQMSVVFLGLSVVAMLAGMLVLLWSSVGPHEDRGNGNALGPSVDRIYHQHKVISAQLVTPSQNGGLIWNDEAKLAVTFTAVAVFLAGLFLMEQVTLYTWDGLDDRMER